MKKYIIFFVFFLIIIGCTTSYNQNKNTELSEKTDNAQHLLNYIEDKWGTNVISGQMDLAWDDSIDMTEKVYDSVNKYPALMGYDFMNVGLSGWNGENQTEEAINWWNGDYNYATNAEISDSTHGIVTFCWHWRDPSGENDAAFYSSSTGKSNTTDYKIPYNIETDTWNTSSPDYTNMMADLNLVATKLTKLKNAGVPVLWRPLHEASGGWFWWGASSAEAYKALYLKMYDYFTNIKDLNNLIWVWNGQSEDWYPGDDYVDIVGWDVYASDYSSQKSLYTAAYNCPNVDGRKIVAMTENGRIPSITNMFNDDAPWAWFMTWNDGTNSGTDSNNFWEGNYYNTDDHKTEVYNDSRVITLDELPDLTSYSLERENNENN